MFTLSNLLGNALQAELDRAAEIVEEEFNDLLESMELASKSSPAGVEGARLEIEEVKKRIKLFIGSRTVTQRRVSVSDKTRGGRVFNILDLGEATPKGDARNYGLRAWPMVTPRRTDFGNRPMTQPNSPTINTPILREPIVFRTVINNPIEARNFTELIFERAQERIDEEGLTVDLSLNEE